MPNWTLEKLKVNCSIIEDNLKIIVMKSKRIIIIVPAIIAIVIIAAVRLVSNKRDFSQQLKMISELNTTIPVITDTVKYEKITTELSVNGSFKPFREISIVSEIQGKIFSITAETGENVKTGQVVASIDNELLKSQLELAKFNLEKAEKDKQRFELLYKGDAATVQQYESAKQTLVNAQSAFTAARIQYDNSFIKVTFDGIITKRYVEKGTYLQPGAPVFDMVEINKVKFLAKLTSDEVEKVQKGQLVKIGADAYPGIIYDGKVNTIIVKSDLSKRYDVEVEVMNRQDKLIKPGMFGTGIFTGHSEEQVLAIQRKAITGSIKNPEVFIVKGDSVVARSITSMPLNDKYILVKQGLQAGDVIVVSGQINLVNGSKIKINK
jgi:membrane fusion protein, multidrug efflux system